MAPETVTEKVDQLAKESEIKVDTMVDKDGACVACVAWRTRAAAIVASTAGAAMPPVPVLVLVLVLVLVPEERDVPRRDAMRRRPPTPEIVC
jgi:hypothetical protein